MNVAEELIEFEDRIDKAHVERRVEDWEHRLRGLYRNVADWLPSGWSASTGDVVHFEDPLMLKFRIEARLLPCLDLQSGSEAVRLEPRGLWIIGANGRVDLIGPLRHFVINDRADNFEPPQWRVARFSDRLHEQPWSEVVLAKMLA